MTIEQPQSVPHEPAQQAASPAAGWYPDSHGVTRFWDGTKWTDHIAPPAVPAYGQGVFVQPNVRQSLDRAQYVRPQAGHSVTKHVILGFLTAGISLIWTIYYAASPNHYFHA